MKIKTSAIVYGIRYIRRFGLRTLIIRIIEKKREKDSEYQSFYLETKASLEQLEKQRMEVSHWNKETPPDIASPAATKIPSRIRGKRIPKIAVFCIFVPFPSSVAMTSCTDIS